MDSIVFQKRMNLPSPNSCFWFWNMKSSSMLWPSFKSIPAPWTTPWCFSCPTSLMSAKEKQLTNVLFSWADSILFLNIFRSIFWISLRVSLKNPSWGFLGISIWVPPRFFVEVFHAVSVGAPPGDSSRSFADMLPKFLAQFFPDKHDPLPIQFSGMISQQFLSGFLARFLQKSQKGTREEILEKSWEKIQKTNDKLWQTLRKQHRKHFSRKVLGDSPRGSPGKTFENCPERKTCKHSRSQEKLLNKLTGQTLEENWWGALEA